MSLYSGYNELGWKLCFFLFIVMGFSMTSMRGDGAELKTSNHSKVTSTKAESIRSKEYWRIHTMPCYKFSEYDPNVITLNQVSVYENTSHFFNYHMMRQCHLKYVDLSTIMPRHSHSFVWISYVGDSLARELFMGAVQRFTNYKPTWHGWDPEREWEKSPLLGAHSGPSMEAEISNYTNTYHKSKLVCCRLPYSESIKRSGYSVHEDKDPCLFALHTDALFEEEKEKFERYKSYLFTNMSEYISTYVSPLYFGKFKCISKSLFFSKLYSYCNLSQRN